MITLFLGYSSTLANLGLCIMKKATISETPLTGIFGSKSAYQVLMFLQNYEQGYASQISKTFGMSLSQAQNQLIKFEQLGVLISRKEGSARVYYYKRGPVVDALRKFLGSMLDALPDSTVSKYYRQRRRPRRYGKT
jgi:DNA-binding transcriptional ArsR family regulator